MKNGVEAVDAIGADGVAEIAGWHQAYGSREAASMIRRGLAVAQKGGEELKAALAEGRIDESFAYNAAQVLSMERVGEGWEAAQRELAGLIGKVGPEELEAVLWGLKRQLSAKADRSDIDWKAAIAEERAKYNAKKGGAEGKLDSDQVLIETADGELKTLGEIEAENFAASGEAQDTASGEVETRSEEASNPKGVGRAEVSPRPDKVSVREKIKNFIKGLLPRKDGTVIKYKESDTDTRRLTEEATKAYNTYASKEYKLPTGGVLYFAPDARTVEAYGGDVGAAWGEYALHLVTHKRGKGDNLYRSFDGSSVDKVLPKIEEIIAANQVKVSDGRIVFFMQTVDGGSKNKSRYACLVTEPDANGNLRVDLRYVTGMQERGFLPGETVTLEEAIRNRTAEGRALHPDQPTTGSRSNTASAQSPESGSSIPNNLPRVNAAEAPELAAAQGAGANRAVELRPVQGRDGVFGTLSHPKARFTVDGEGKVVYVEGLTPEDFAPEKAGQTAALVARIEAYAVGNGLKIGIGDEATLEAWRATRDRIKAEAEEAFSRRQAEERRSTVVERLKQSGLATEVVDTKGDFDRMLVELNGRPLTADEEVYGFCDTSTGKVYLNPDFFATRQALEAPIHEFGHLGIIAAEKVNKPVYDRGMKLAGELLESGLKPAAPIKGGVAEIVDFILNDKYYSTRSRKEQAEELLAQLIGKRGAEALKNETNKTVVNRIKAWLVEFWNTFGKAMGLKDITPEQAEKMTVEEVADAIRAEMLSGRKYGEGLDRVEFGLTEGGSAVRIVTKPVRIKRKLTGRRKAVNEFVKRMGGGDDPANVETDLLALWVDNGGRLFDAMPYEISTGYSKGASGVKKTRRAVADEFAESTEFYRGLDAAQRRVFFGTGKLEPGSIGEGLKQRLAEAGITRFTNEDGTVDYEGLIDEFKRQWTNYERGEEVLKERNEWQEERDRAFVEEMERAEQAAYDEISAEEAAARAEMEAADEATAAQIAADIAAGRFSRAGAAEGTSAVGTVDAEKLAFVDTPLSAKSYREAREILRKKTGRKFTNAGSGLAASLSGNSINKILSGKAVAKSVGVKQHLAAAANIVELFEGGELRATEGGNRKGVKNAKRVFARFDLDGEKLVAKITVLEHERDDHRIYSVEAMEVSKAGSILAPKDSKSQAENPALPSTPGSIPQTGAGAQGGRRRLHDVTQIKEETLSQLTGSTQGHSAAPGISAREVLQGQNPDAGSSTGGIIPQTGAGAQGGGLKPAAPRGVRWSRSGIFTGTAADYANRSRQGGKDDGPSLKKIGTGEGSQVYGWGLYGSTVRGVAEGYAENHRKKLDVERKPNEVFIDGKKQPWTRTPEGEAARAFDEAEGDRGKAIANLREAVERMQGWLSSGKIRGERFIETYRRNIANNEGAIKLLEDESREITRTVNSARPKEHLYEQTWFTNRAPGDESHLLKWYEPVTKSS